MTFTLTLREPPAVPLEAAELRPDRVAGLSRTEVERLELRLGNRRATVGELFAVAGSGGGDLRLEGDLRRVKFLGAGMAAGRLAIAGDAGAHVGAGMHGGELTVDGDAGDWAGANMRGGRLVVRGSAGDRLGAAYTGERAGMRGGEIVVHGDAGAGAGEGLRRGLIGVGGSVGAGAGLRMLAGTLIAFGAVAPRPGAGMRRGTIVSMSAPELLPTFAYACSYRPPFLRLFLRHLRSLGLPVADAQLGGRFARWSGDGLDLNRGEVLIWEAPA